MAGHCRKDSTELDTFTSTRAFHVNKLISADTQIANTQVWLCQEEESYEIAQLCSREREKDNPTAATRRNAYQKCWL